MYRLGSRCVRLSLLVPDGDDDDQEGVSVTSCTDEEEDATQSLLQYSNWDDERRGGYLSTVNRSCSTNGGLLGNGTKAGGHHQHPHQQYKEHQHKDAGTAAATPDLLGSTHDFL